MAKKHDIVVSDDLVRVPLRVKITPYLIMAPAVLLTIGILYPFLTSVYYSFTNYSLRSSDFSWIGLGNWIKMFSNEKFWNALWVTFQYSALCTGVEMLLGLGIALLLLKDSRYTKVLRLLLIFPLMVAPVIATLVWQLMINNSAGILEKLLNTFGVFNFPWASSPQTAMFTVVLIDVWVYCPFVMLLMLAGLQSFPKSPFEAARIDGGSAWFTFRTLTLPMLKPFAYIALIFRLMASMQEFAIIYALTKGGPGSTLMNFSVSAYSLGFTFSKFAESLPYMLFLWIVIYFISQKLVGRWLKNQQKTAGR